MEIGKNTKRCHSCTKTGVPLVSIYSDGGRIATFIRRIGVKLPADETQLTLLICQVCAGAIRKCEDDVSVLVCNFQDLVDHPLVSSSVEPQEDNLESVEPTRKNLRSNVRYKKAVEKPLPQVEEGSKLKEFACAQCSRSYILRRRLTAHIKRVHLKVLPFACDRCGYRAVSHSHIRKHIEAVHLKLRKHACSLCSSKFSIKSSLGTHLMTRHGIEPDGKTYTCTACQKRFLAKGDFKYHMRVHSDDRPFECPVCPKSFKSKAHMKSHFRRCKN